MQVTTTRLKKENVTILNAQQATGPGPAINVTDYKNITITMSVAGQGAGDSIVVKLKGSNSGETAPAFGSAATAANPWDFIQLVELENGSVWDGATGITFSNQNETRKFQINAQALNWVTLDVITYTDADVSGSITATLSAYND